MPDARYPPDQISIHNRVEVVPTRPFLDELGWFAARNTEVLSDVVTTFQRQEMGIELVYGLDFEIIYSYANPWAVDARHARLICYLLENDRVRLTLLPGTVEELFAFLRYALRKQVEASLLTERLEEGNATDETLACARSLCSSVSLGSCGSSPKAELALLSRELIVARERYAGALARVHEVLTSDRIVPLAEVFPRTDIQLFEESVQNSVFIELARIRRGARNSPRNRADAKNIATILQHTALETQVYRADRTHYKGHLLRLLTTTPAILRLPLYQYEDVVGQDLAHTLAGTLDYILHSYAFRTCFEAAYAAAVGNHCDFDPVQCRHVAGEQLAKAHQLQAMAQAVDNVERDQRLAGEKETAHLGIIAEHIVPHFAAEFLTDTWYQTVRHLLTLEAREYNSKPSSPEAEEQWWEQSEDPLTAVASRHLDELQRKSLTLVQLKYKCRAPKNVLAQFGIASRDVELVGESVPKRWLVESSFALNGDEIFMLDKMHQVWYASWPSGLALHQVRELINDLFCKEHGLLSCYSYEGEEVWVFEDAEDTKQASSLPLKEVHTKSDYDFLVAGLGESGWGNGTVPSAIHCDTTVCSTRFDIMRMGTSEGVMMAFREPGVWESVKAVFRATSGWAKEWPYADNLVTLIDGGFQEKEKKWP